MCWTTEESWFDFLLQNVRTPSEAQPAPIQWLPAAAFPGLERPGCKAGHSPPSSAEVKNEWSYTSAPSVCFHNAYRNKFSFARFLQQCSVSVFWVMAPRQCLIGHRRFDRMCFPQLFNLWRQDHHGVWKLRAPVFRWRGSLPSRMEIWTSASILPPLYSKYCPYWLIWIWISVWDRNFSGYLLQ